MAAHIPVWWVYFKNGQYSRDYDQNQCVLTGSILLGSVYLETQRWSKKSKLTTVPVKLEKQGKQALFCLLGRQSHLCIKLAMLDFCSLIINTAALPYLANHKYKTVAV